MLLDRQAGWRLWPQLVARADAPDLIRDQVARSGLRGRGGAGFPAARKWQAVAAEPGPRYVVANGDEGDPGSYADRLLMETYPDRVLEGLALAGLACSATAGVVYVRSEYPQALASMREAVARARADGHLGRGVHGSDVDFDVEVAQGAGSYVAGEETSLLRSLAGLRGTVRLRPPYPVQSGLFGRPTAVNNVETLSAVPAILDRGGDAYARLGRAPEAGTLLVCLNERFVRPGAYEVELGTPLSEIVYGLGGGLPPGRTLRAVQVGGPLGGFLPPGRLDLPLLASALDSAGVALGHGGIIAVDDTVPADALLAQLWRFYAAESCGACTPCRKARAAAPPTRRPPPPTGPANADGHGQPLPVRALDPRAVRSLVCALAEDPRESHR
ncbi:NADH-ubiquinone oxidoreductase-F iron-sulfur binding region domain-containing protein [Catellatospora bangladeshensis]|uniref:NADH-ubiquinone oxidoreductase-F iron-sulfur binding region domain-containing protein n=1 Tax=Catellatospora bangladeshensis TaxID=310355 RepID=UPI00360E94E7